MSNTYLNLEDITNWVISWSQANSSPSSNDIANFCEELNSRVLQMDFSASNGGAAIGYAGKQLSNSAVLGI